MRLNARNDQPNVAVTKSIPGALEVLSTLFKVVSTRMENAAIALIPTLA
jgi:hypothetical protein